MRRCARRKPRGSSGRRYSFFESSVFESSGSSSGGISNGEPIVVRAAFKPTATIRKAQETVNRDLESVVLEAQGRHDPCVLPRAVPIVEAMVCLVLCDQLLRQRAIESPAFR